VLSIIIDESVMEPPIEVLYAQFQIDFQNSTIPWLIAPEHPDSSFIDISTGSGFLELDLANIDLLPNGNFLAIILVELSGIDGLIRTINARINLSLTGIPPSQISTDKSTYNLVFNRDTNELTGETAVGIINNNDPIQLKFWQNQIVFAPAENFTTGFTLADNPTTSLATNPVLPATGSISIPAKILKQTGEFVQGFTINLVIVDGGITVQPTSLYFEVFKGSAEKSAVLTVTNPLGVDFQVTEFPEWLILDDLDGNTSQNINVTTETDLLPVGTYNANIKFEFNDDFILIPVTLDLKAFIIIDESKDFCLDLPPVKVNRKSADAKFVRITMTSVYKVLGVTSTFEKVYQTPYFLDVASFELGEKLHRHFPRAKQHFFNETEFVFMENIVASIKVDELNANLEVLFTESASDIKLFPGKKPAAYPLLSNFIHRKKNENAVIFTSEVDAEEVIFKKTAENDLVNPLIIGAAEINFYDFPKTYAPVHVQWENQNLVPEWFTFTGDYKVSPDFNHIYARNIFKAQNEKYDSSKVRTLLIDTGMILAKERELISEMIDNKLAFIKIEGKIYRCFNITKKNVEIDSSEELVARPLEYLIVEE
ncbi:MAG TPA: hypothetical protein P5084_10650, partial [Paludibacter sp.]|nr:hypothetical protein [Paludibacter sp.]